MVKYDKLQRDFKTYSKVVKRCMRDPQFLEENKKGFCDLVYSLRIKADEAEAGLRTSLDYTNLSTELHDFLYSTFSNRRLENQVKLSDLHKLETEHPAQTIELNKFRKNKEKSLTKEINTAKNFLDLLNANRRRRIKKC